MRKSAPLLAVVPEWKNSRGRGISTYNGETYDRLFYCHSLDTRKDAAAPYFGYECEIPDAENASRVYLVFRRM